MFESKPGRKPTKGKDVPLASADVREGGILRAEPKERLRRSPPSMVKLRFISCSKSIFTKSYLPSDSHTNTVISDRFCLPVKMASKTMIRLIVI